MVKLFTGLLLTVVFSTAKMAETVQSKNVLMKGKMPADLLEHLESEVAKGTLTVRQVKRSSDVKSVATSGVFDMGHVEKSVIEMFKTWPNQAREAWLIAALDYKCKLLSQERIQRMTFRYVRKMQRLS